MNPAKATILALALALAVALPVAAIDEQSDSDALGAYVATWVDLKDAVSDVYMRYMLAASAAEQSDIAEEVRNVLGVTEDTMDALPVRACFQSVANNVRSELGALISAFHIDATPDDVIGARAIANAAVARISSLVVIAVIQCAPVDIDAADV
jgi:hypothetical protein